MTYHSSILTNNYENCYVCGKPACELHHVLHGADKKKSEELGLMAPLCRDCHNSVHHYGGALDLELKKDAQRVLLIKMCGMCYI